MIEMVTAQEIQSIARWFPTDLAEVFHRRLTELDFQIDKGLVQDNIVSLMGGSAPRGDVSEMIRDWLDNGIE